VATEYRHMLVVRGPRGGFRLPRFQDCPWVAFFGFPFFDVDLGVEACHIDSAS
jgi:hypothetical protein